MNIDNIINAANYESICDFSIIPPEGKIFTGEILSRDATIFCKTDFLPYLFQNIYNSKFKYTIITHHSDYSITKNIFEMRPKCVDKWYAINVDHIHPDLIPIPLGLKTHRGIYVERVGDKICYDIDWLSNNIESLRINDKSDSIYCNWGLTNVDRNFILKDMDKTGVKYTWETGLSYYEYLDRLSKHKFCISPPGNGIDCHRTWEALYVGCIPIVIKNDIYERWDSLPILSVNRYSDITDDLLNSFNRDSYDASELYMNFWKNKIKSI